MLTSRKSVLFHLFFIINLPFYFSDKVAVSMRLTRSTDSLYTFGIYGRDFSRDGMKPTTGNGSSVRITLICFSGVLYMIYKYI